MSQKPQVRSFDVFDTLLARRVPQPTQVFAQIPCYFSSRQLEATSFVPQRIRAEQQSNGTFVGIYDILEKELGLNTEERCNLEEAELRAEEANVFLVTEVYEQVQDGDLLVSDMYLTPAQVMRLLRHAGFQRDVHLVVSQGGPSKADRRIWPILLERFDILLHTGDNAVSDVRGPQTFGIPTQHTTRTLWTPLEQFLHEQEVGWVSSLYEFRVNQPTTNETTGVWSRLQLEQNIPLLMLFALDLQHRFPNESLWLTQRDCCLLERILRWMGRPFKTFHTSRLAAQIPCPTFERAIAEQHTPDTVIVDIYGSFSSVPFYERILGGPPRWHTLVYSGEGYPYCGQTYCMRNTRDDVEKLNYAEFGTLVSFDRTGQPHRLPLEYDIRVAEVYRETVDAFLVWLEPHRHNLTVDWTRWHDKHWQKVYECIRVHVPLEHCILHQPIVQARYGSGDTWADVTVWVRALWRTCSDRDSVVCNALLGDIDPCVGVVKTVEVTWWNGRVCRYLEGVNRLPTHFKLPFLL